jgi:hypothetical protein
MPQRNYIVRDGFVVVQTVVKADKSTFTRTTSGGEPITLDDDEAAQHAHKLELASQKDRDAALEAEQQAKIAAHANNAPVALVQTLVEALQHALSGGATAAA